jgi:hypothetical protein
MKALIARRDSRYENLHSNNIEAPQAQRKRFEGPKLALEEYGGAAGPKKMI